jgi:hypothetical protein
VLQSVDVVSRCDYVAQTERKERYQANLLPIYLRSIISSRNYICIARVTCLYRIAFDPGKIPSFGKNNDMEEGNGDFPNTPTWQGRSHVLGISWILPLPDLRVVVSGGLMAGTAEVGFHLYNTRCVGRIASLVYTTVSSRPVPDRNCT